MGKDLKGKELGKGLSQRKNGDYSARYVNKLGKRVQKYFKKVQEARIWLEEEKQRDTYENYYKPKELTVDECFSMWLLKKQKRCKELTVLHYEDVYKHFKPFIGNMLITDVDVAMCDNIILELSDRYHSNTLKNYKSVMHDLFEDYVLKDIIPKNPWNKLVRTDIGIKSENRDALTIEEQKKFMQEAKKNKYYCQIALMLQTGIRVGELMALTWKDVDFERKLIDINKTLYYTYKEKEWKCGEPKTKSGYRKIPIFDEVIELLKEQYLKDKNIKIVNFKFSDNVFLSSKGDIVKKYCYGYHIIEICKSANIRPVSAHVLRHTFATRCIENGMSPKTLQGLLGHSDINTTMNRYVHSHEEYRNNEFRAIYEKMKACSSI